RVEKLTYESEPGIAIPSLLFLPANGATRHPAVVLLDARGKSGSVEDAEALARAGNVVLVPDLRGFGETQPGTVRRESRIGDFGDYRSSMTALLIGKTMPGMRALDIIAGVDLLAGRAEVDPARIKAWARDAAAVPLVYAALFDPRIASIAVSGMLSSYDSVVSDNIFRGLADQIVPSALKYFDLPDLISAIAPRPLAIFNSVNPLGQALTIGSMREQYARSSAAYKAAGAPGSFQLTNHNEHQEPLGNALLQWAGSSSSGR
ncbi:MAG: metalloendopeptidase-like rane protein, partial [Bryobacterales bacterium]|nr:metalloendopeptidase-like rane protein [Bryobacterales bacterium]